MKIIKDWRRKIYQIRRGIEKNFEKSIVKHPSYSQDGEDRILYFYFASKGRFIREGFFVDVGAFHPSRFSNTKLFYDHGWRGINIDATPGTMKPFLKTRTKDINLEIAIGGDGEESDFYMFKRPGLNGFLSQTFVETNYKKEQLLNVIKIKSFPLSQVFDEYLSNGQSIDFISIDVEGKELDVLKTNDWQKYRPEVILVETHYLDLEFPQNNPVCAFLKTLDYRLFAKTNMTAFFHTLTK